ncbi:hypothetical protein FS842_002147, partial [Serendipita sp. 407]
MVSSNPFFSSSVPRSHSMNADDDGSSRSTPPITAPTDRIPSTTSLQPILPLVRRPVLPPSQLGRCRVAQNYPSLRLREHLVGHEHGTKRSGQDAPVFRPRQE